MAIDGNLKWQWRHLPTHPLLDGEKVFTLGAVLSLKRHHDQNTFKHSQGRLLSQVSLSMWWLMATALTSLPSSHSGLHVDGGNQ